MMMGARVYSLGHPFDPEFDRQLDDGQSLDRVIPLIPGIDLGRGLDSLDAKCLLARIKVRRQVWDYKIRNHLTSLNFAEYSASVDEQERGYLTRT